MTSWMRGGVVALVLAALAACGETAAPTAGAPSLSRGAVTPTKPAEGSTIVAIAAGNPNFSTLVAAVVRAGFVEALSAKGQRTVFAPTNAAFAKLGLTAANINTVPIDVLQNILLYHVAPGARLAADVVASESIRMANGERTVISLRADGSYIDESKIIGTDIVATNGVVHVIDAVLMP